MLWSGVTGFTEMNGYIINNSPDITHTKSTVTIDWNCVKNISIYGAYVRESKTEKELKETYTYTMALAGLKCIF
jgi:hypothetical protein